MKDARTSNGGKHALWLRMGSVAAFAALTLTMSACTYNEPENGTQPAPVNTEALGKDYETATPSPGATSGAGSTETTAPSASALPTIPADVVDSSALPSSVTKEEIEEMRSVAKAFVSAHHGSSWTDPKQTSWVTNTAPFTTAQFQRELEATYTEGNSVRKWDEMKKNQTKRFAEISSAVVGIGEAYDKGQVSIKVDYLVSVTSNQITGTQVLSENHKYVNLSKVDGKWKVASFNNVAGGGA